MRRRALSLFNSQQSGLILIIVALGVILTGFAGSHMDRSTGATVNNFLNLSTIVQVITDASRFAIMAVGATIVIISGGIDLSVGSIYALCGVLTAMTLRSMGAEGPEALWIGALLCCGIGIVCGALNGLMVSALGVHPFIITLGTMWIYRGTAFVASKAESVLVPDSLMSFAKFGFGDDLYPVPMLVMLLVSIVGSLYLSRTVAGRWVFALGGNAEASRYSGLPIRRILINVYTLSGLTAGVAAFLGISYYGSASCGDATGYELYVIAAAVVGGASLTGGKGSAFGAMFGALLIVLIRQSIRTLHFDQNYEWVVIGVAVIIAVVLDRWNARTTQRRLARR